MAEEKKTVAKNTSWGSRFINWWKVLPKRIATAFKNMWYELKKVTWPSKHKLMIYSVIVLVFVLVMTIVIGVLDMGASELVRLIHKL